MNEGVQKISLVGKRKLIATISKSDWPKVCNHHWGFHPRGVFDHTSQTFLVRLLFPTAKKVLYRDKNPLNCTRENLLPTGSDFPEECARRAAKTIKEKPTASGIEGVFFDAAKNAFLVHRKSQNKRFCQLFPIKNNNRTEALQQAVATRTLMLRLSHSELERIFSK